MNLNSLPWIPCTHDNLPKNYHQMFDTWFQCYLLPDPTRTDPTVDQGRCDSLQGFMLGQKATAFERGLPWGFMPLEQFFQLASSGGPIGSEVETPESLESTLLRLDFEKAASQLNALRARITTQQGMIAQPLPTAPKYGSDFAKVYNLNPSQKPL